MTAARNALHRPSHGWSTAQQALSDGIVKRDGEINVENMRLFTRIYAAQFYYNLCDSYAKSTVGTVLASFDELSGRKDYKASTFSVAAV